MLAVLLTFLCICTQTQSLNNLCDYDAVDILCFSEVLQHPVLPTMHIFVSHFLSSLQYFLVLAPSSKPIHSSGAQARVNRGININCCTSGAVGGYMGYAIYDLLLFIYLFSFV